MKQDEFAFFNQQLAAMLRDGIPLEGALQRLCEEMRRGALRDELLTLQADLAKGTPMAEALASRQLPELYKRMIVVGIKSGDLPGALTMLADHFQRQNNVWIRLKGLMAYPLLVLLAAFLLSCFLSFILDHFIWANLMFLANNPQITPARASLWMIPVVIGCFLAAGLIAVCFSSLRQKLCWRLPAFREASLAQAASIIWLMLKNGVPLADALALLEGLEKGTRAESEIAGWRQRLASGQGKFSAIAASSQTGSTSVFPPLFVWTVSQAGEDMVAGFQHAAEIYHARAAYRVEMFLYSALPCAVLALAVMIVSQIQPLFAVLTSFLQSLSGD